MQLVVTDAIVKRRTSSAGILFCPVAVGAPIKCGSNKHTAPAVRSSQVRPFPVISHTPLAVAIAVPAHQSWRWYKSATATPGG